MTAAVFHSGPFTGVSVNDAFAQAASRESPVVVNVGPISWPANLKPTPQPLGSHQPGTKITGPVGYQTDVLILLYTNLEISALLDVFTGDKDWTPARKRTWYPYSHNFDQYKGSIAGLNDDDALKDGIFGYLFALTIGAR